MLFYLSKGSYVNNTRVTIEKPQRLLKAHTVGFVFTNADAVGEYNNLEAFLPTLRIPIGDCWLVDVEEESNKISITIVDRQIQCETYVH